MKVYLIKHKGHKTSIRNLDSWARMRGLGGNGIFVESVNAFLRKKDAKKWLEEGNLDHLDIVSATLDS